MSANAETAKFLATLHAAQRELLFITTLIEADGQRSVHQKQSMYKLFAEFILYVNQLTNELCQLMGQDELPTTLSHSTKRPLSMEAQSDIPAPKRQYTDIVARSGVPSNESTSATQNQMLIQAVADSTVSPGGFLPNVLEGDITHGSRVPLPQHRPATTSRDPPARGMHQPSQESRRGGRGRGRGRRDR